MLGLGWQYRWGCAWLLSLQGLLQLAAISTLYLTGYGIDLVRYHAQNTTVGPPTLWFFESPADWRPMPQIALVAVLVLALELVRGSLNYIYALSAGTLIHTRIVPDLRGRVYDKLQRLSFRFFDANATGSIIQRVTSDTQSVRAFIDGVLIQFVVLTISFACYLVNMLSLNVGLTLACLATTPIMWLVTVIFSRLVRPMYDRNRELVDRVVLRLAESKAMLGELGTFKGVRDPVPGLGPGDSQGVQEKRGGVAVSECGGDPASVDFGHKAKHA